MLGCICICLQWQIVGSSTSHSAVCALMLTWMGTELIYVHSKLMIVDDCTVIIGQTLCPLPTHIYKSKIGSFSGIFRDFILYHPLKALVAV